MGVGSSNGSWATSNNHTNKKNNDNKLTVLMQIFSKREWQMEQNDWKNVMCDHKRSLGLCKKAKPWSCACYPSWGENKYHYSKDVHPPIPHRRKVFILVLSHEMLHLYNYQHQLEFSLTTASTTKLFHNNHNLSLGMISSI